VFAPVQAAIASPFGQIVLFGFTVALFYHLGAGLRHLAWDTGWGFEKSEFNATSIWIFAFAALATVFVWVIGHFLT
jgi:succinate dehydrogenase / fumarate reductase cytochrome b subunit